MVAALGLVLGSWGYPGTPVVASAPNVDRTGEINRNVTYEALVRRSDGGVPNVKADDYASLGYGTGYAMAEDNVCMIADLVITFAAQRSELLGATPQNVSSDSFYQLFIDRGAAEEPLESKQAAVFRGAAAGFNRYLRDTGVDAITDPGCRGASWVRPVDELDLRRISRMPFFLPALSTQFLAAAPPTATGSAGARVRAGSTEPTPEEAIARLFDEDRGSNGVAIGAAATAGGGGMLLANPHLSWNTPAQRMYALHQTIPGEMNMTGATTMGRIQVAFGATEDIAWTATVSRASDYTFYRLQLVPGKPTHYLFDGAEREMVREVVEVEVPDGNGGTTNAEHTFYSTHYGARLVGGPGFAWNDDIAYAVRPTDPGWRGVESLNESWKATSVREFEKIQNKYQFQGTNVMAADSSGETYYTDANPIPYFTDDQRAACAVPGGYDGSRSECMWKIDPTAANDFTFGPDATPHLFRDDFVSNMNDSYWLANPAQPLTGYDGAFGVTGTERTLRTRAGLSAIEQRLSGTDGEVGNKFTLGRLQKLMFSNTSYSGVILRDGMVELCEDNPTVTGPDSTVTDISEACGVLEGWDLHDDLESRGAHLFREIMAAGRGGRVLPANWNYLVDFDPEDPVNTPRDLDPEDNDAVLQAIAAAVTKLRAADVDLDARLGDVQSVTRNGVRIPMHGGTGESGLFNILTAPFNAAAGGYPEVSSGASWIQASEFRADGLVSRGILAFSQSTNPNSPHYSDMTRMYSKKQWVDLPVTESDVAAATTSSTYLVEDSGVCLDDGWREGLGVDFADERACLAHYDGMRSLRLQEYDARHAPSGSAYTGKSLTITGVARVGRKLKLAEVSPADFSPVPESVVVQWLRNGRPIVGATARTYVVQPADVGAQLTARVTAMTGGRAVGSATTKAIQPRRAASATKVWMVPGKRTIDITAKVGSTATVTGWVRITVVRNGKVIRSTKVAVNRRGVAQVHVARNRGAYKVTARYRGSAGVAPSHGSQTKKVR
ncbi:penicillin acylase family protein [Nocardioides sp. W7]|uniref:penicillin acylase family protein n=1 Tax=Nocardioides sp. W7 TaxID=2931390 RepID=UPI001FD469F6|nr:penicillin acylase family protein [Nocardioides sp. W7]